MNNHLINDKNSSEQNNSSSQKSSVINFSSLFLFHNIKTFDIQPLLKIYENQLILKIKI